MGNVHPSDRLVQQGRELVGDRVEFRRQPHEGLTGRAVPNADDPIYRRPEATDAVLHCPTLVLHLFDLVNQLSLIHHKEPIRRCGHGNLLRSEPAELP